MTDYYPKPEQRNNNAIFLKKVFPQGIKGTYIELLGGHDPNDKKGTDQMYDIMVKSGLITSPKSFVGVDLDPVVLYHRMENNKDIHPYPVVFSDIFTAVKRIQRNDWTDINNQTIETNGNIVAINFDIGREAIDNNWWELNERNLRDIIKNAWQYTDRVAFIGNFSRDRGTKHVENLDTTKERIDFRKVQLLDSIVKAFNIDKKNVKNKETIIESFEDYYCRGRMTYVRFVIYKKDYSIVFYDKDGRKVNHGS